MKIDHRLLRVLVGIFALRTPIQWFWKPLLFLSVMIALGVGVERLITPSDESPSVLLMAVRVILTGAPFTMIGFVVVNHLDRLQHRLSILASTDLLTDLPNRRVFLEHVSHAHRHGDKGVLILLDADHFKRINDTYGHAVGDACLRAIADRLRQATVSADQLGRLGGEEFSIYLNEDRARDATKVADALVKPISVMVGLVEEAIHLTLSAGLTRMENGLAVKDLLHRADQALYDAKNGGRAKWSAWNDTLTPIRHVA